MPNLREPPQTHIGMFIVLQNELPQPGSHTNDNPSQQLGAPLEHAGLHPELDELLLLEEELLELTGHAPSVNDLTPAKLAKHPFI